MEVGMIECTRLAFSLGGRTILSNLELTVSDGERIVVMGRSGAGKTTLLRLLAGLVAPSEGSIRVNGELASVARSIRMEPSHRDIGFVFQAGALWPHMTVAQNLLYGLADLPRPEARRRMTEALDACKVAELALRLPQQLSGGEQRRVALARAIAPHPRHLLMDEPLTNLDTDLRSELLQLVCEIVRSHDTALVYVTHDESEARAVGGRQMRLENGRLLTNGSA
jgi:iron(III) transport system ATP-binding protein